MSDTETGQVNTDAAEIYEEFFILALFQEWAIKVSDSAKIQTGQKALDVACRTGIVAREIFKRVGLEGSVIGLDVNKGMLAVARQKAPKIEWREGAAESIPFEDESFDTVVSQFGLMFFVDKVAAIKEMFRVLKSGGRLAIAVWDSLENTVGYKKVVNLLNRLFGNEVAAALRSPYSLGDPQIFKSLFKDAGVLNAKIKKVDGKARFPSTESWIFTDVKGWTLADIIDEDQYKLLLNKAEKELNTFVLENKTIEFDHPAYIISASKI